MICLDRGRAMSIFDQSLYTKRAKEITPEYFLISGTVYFFQTGAKYGSLFDFAKHTKGRVWVSDALNAVWFKYKIIDGECCIEDMRLN
jgi:hypothetical protein